MYSLYSPSLQLTLRRVRRGEVRPPQKMTVTMVMREVVVRNICLAVVIVFWIAKAKAIAPLRPENQSMC